MDNFQLDFPFEVKELGPTGEFEGWASTYDVDLGNDKVLPGAFTTTLRKSQGKVPVLFNHNSSQIAGVGISALEDNRGLFVKAQLALGTQLGRETYELMNIGALKGLSIGYKVPEKGMVYDGRVRLLKTIDLIEYSATPFPMNQQAGVTRVKCIDDMTPRDLEDQLRDVFGLSQKDAKRVISEGFKHLLSGGSTGREHEEQKDEEARTFLKEMRADVDARAALLQMGILAT